jgi:hypothetical protein
VGAEEVASAAPALVWAPHTSLTVLPLPPGRGSKLRRNEYRANDCVSAREIEDSGKRETTGHEAGWTVNGFNDFAYTERHDRLRVLLSERHRLDQGVPLRRRNERLALLAEVS